MRNVVRSRLVTTVGRTLMVASTVLMLSGGVAMAQGGHSHAAANGGQIQSIGTYEAELVVKGADMTLYIVDNQEKKVDASKYSATAVVLAAGNQQKTVELSPSGENRSDRRSGNLGSTPFLRWPKVPSRSRRGCGGDISATRFPVAVS